MTADPTDADHDCRPYLGGSTETCEYESSSEDTLTIGVFGWADEASTYQIKVTWENADR
ncbi:MAG: hypothetical protein JRH20_30625 [Deltaproteobacteria bacterium]|nr:hypothetical protein [Deltaproteobacteria bacterium]